MDITWHGHSCFTIKGKRATVVIDPYADMGFKMDKLKGDILMVTDMKAGKLAEVAGDPVKVDLPGEFEIKEVIIQGVQAWEKPDDKSEDKKDAKKDKSQSTQKTIVYVFHIDDMSVCHLGSIDHALSDEMIEKIGDVDILLVPTGGKECVDAKKAHEIIDEIEPRIVIPMNYAVDGEKMEYDPVDALLKMSGTNPEAKDVFSIANKAALPQDKMEYVVLNAK